MVSRVFMICNSYESGYGHGLANDGLDLSKTPHADPEQGEAYQIGYDACQRSRDLNRGVRERRLTMQLRIYRTWKWVAAFEPMIGQKAPLKLQACEELQYRNHKNEWVPLPVEEAEKPEHPDAAESRRRNEELKASLAGIRVGLVVGAHDDK